VSRGGVEMSLARPDSDRPDTGRGGSKQAVGVKNYGKVRSQIAVRSINREEGEQRHVNEGPSYLDARKREE